MTRREFAWALVGFFAFGILLAPQPKAYAKPARRVGEVFNTAATGNANVFGTDFTPGYATVAVRITVAIQTTDSVLELRVTNSATSQDYKFNGGTALVAGNLYTFQFGVSRSDTYNFQFVTGCTIGKLLVEEIDEAS